MCLIIFAHQVSAQFPLVVAANRDEFHERPTAPSAFWQEHPQVLAGRDLELGGTWLGTTRTGRFAAVTNFRDPDRTAPAPCSRGALPLDFLLGTASPQRYLQAVAQRAHQYAGFNLLVGTGDALWYLSNSPGEQPQPLAPGIYGLSNARLDTPWPKAEKGKAKLMQLMDAAELSHESLAEVVADQALAERSAADAAPVISQMDHLLSGQFIVGPHYGTRCTTTLWKTAQSQLHWQELSFDAEGQASHCQRQTFRLSAKT
ncbi:MAG: NRDE family protein [Gammaproteobacteria bacterium]|nr:NRDE family protein [Gammaproteobacteria bacterium]